MVLTNQEIFNYALLVKEAFLNNNTEIRYIKAVVNFYLQKNIALLMDLGKEIENTRNKIFSSYGDEKQPGTWQIPPESIPLVEQEINSLMKLPQEVKIFKIKLSDIKNLEFSTAEMKAILFMIDDDLSEEE